MSSLAEQTVITYGLLAVMLGFVQAIPGFGLAGDPKTEERAHHLCQ